MSKKALTEEQIAKRQRIKKILNWVMLGAGILLYGGILFAGPEILQFWFDPDVDETAILLAALFLMGIIIYIIIFFQFCFIIFSVIKKIRQY